MYKYVARACLDTCVLAEQDGTTRNFPSSTHGSSFFIWGPFPDRRRSAELDAKQLFIRTMEKKKQSTGESGVMPLLVHVVCVCGGHGVHGMV